MFKPKLKNCRTQCTTQQVTEGNCKCYNTVLCESGPYNGTNEFEAYLDAFCFDLKYTRSEIYNDPALLETVWGIYKSLKNI